MSIMLREMMKLYSGFSSAFKARVKRNKEFREKSKCSNYLPALLNGKPK